MHKQITSFTILTVLMLAFFGCAPAGPAPSAIKSPVVKLARVEVGSYFPLPWREWPAQPPTPTPAFNVVPRQPLNLGFLFDLENPNDLPVTLEQMKFTVELETGPAVRGEYFALSTPNVYDRQSVAPQSTNTLRVNVVLDSAVVPGTLAVAYGQRMAEKKLSAPALVNFWWDKIQEFGYGLKVTGGTADFAVGSGKQLVTFEGKWPK